MFNKVSSKRKGLPVGVCCRWTHDKWNVEPFVQSSLAHLTVSPVRTSLHKQKMERCVWRHSHEHHQSPSGMMVSPTQSTWNHVPCWHSALEHLIISTFGWTEHTITKLMNVLTFPMSLLFPSYVVCLSVVCNTIAPRLLILSILNLENFSVSFCGDAITRGPAYKLLPCRWKKTFFAYPIVVYLM